MNPETPRQKKIAAVLQQELAEMLQGAIRAEGVANLLISITKVSVTSDLSLAKVYLSIFPSKNTVAHLDALRQNSSQIRHDLSQKLRHQLRRIPELTFYIDDSLDYIEQIDRALGGSDNPIKTTKVPNKP
ncbi:MAG: 30S ribosome-binding factor RbfA [Flavobacteriaceae bacterium]